MTESFSNLKQILNGVQFKNLNPVYAEIINNWDEIIGKKFQNKTILKDIMQKNGNIYIYVNVKSSAILQELNFFKHNIISKIQEKYNLKIEDIIIKLSSQSIDKKENFKQTEVQEVFNLRPSEKELNKISLAEQALNEIINSVNKQSTLSASQKERMIEIIIKDLKTQEWMKQKGFPVCEKCGHVMIRKTFGEKNICQFCQGN